MNNIAIQLTNVSKKYEIHHEKPTLVEKFVKGPNETFWALDNINLTIKKGEKVGIIGLNGSGKTTLLKTIVGITSPSAGTIITNGKIVSLIDLDAGFHPDLTGYQNIYLNGMLLGMPKQEITKKIRAIIRYADIHQFIDTPLFTYSQGMILRLGFSIAIHADPDILILDEGLLVGDQEFLEKNKHVIMKLFHQNKTILVASHWLDYIEKNCQRIIGLHKGTIIHDGSKSYINTYKNQYS